MIEMTMESQSIARARFSQPCARCAVFPKKGCLVCEAMEARAREKVHEVNRLLHSFAATSQPERINIHARNILALDLGTATGWAIRRRDGSMAHGTEKFPDRKRAHPGQRWADFRAWLARTLEAGQVHAIAYEHVSFHAGVRDAHCYGAFRALVEMAASSRNIELLPVGVGTIKKAWTGKGNADKAAMIAEAKRRGFKPGTDNDADALAILSWAAMQEGE